MDRPSALLPLMGLPLYPDPPCFRMESGVMKPFPRTSGTEECGTGVWLLPPPTMVPPPTMLPPPVAPISSFQQCPYRGYLDNLNYQETPNDQGGKRSFYGYRKSESQPLENLRGVSPFDSNLSSPSIPDGFHSLDFPNVAVNRLYPPSAPRFAANHHLQPSFGFFDNCRYSPFTGPATNRRPVLSIQPRIDRNFYKMKDHGFFNSKDSWRRIDVRRVSPPVRVFEQSHSRRRYSGTQYNGPRGRSHVPMKIGKVDSVSVAASGLKDSDHEVAVNSEPQLNEPFKPEEVSDEARPDVSNNGATIDSVYDAASSLQNCDLKEVPKDEPQPNEVFTNDEMSEKVDVVACNSVDCDREDGEWHPEELDAHERQEAAKSEPQPVLRRVKEEVQEEDIDVVN